MAKCIPDVKMHFILLFLMFYLARTVSKKWQGVIGLEIHAQISSKSKLFSGSATEFAAPINSQVAFLDAALPGTLPRINHQCVEAGVLTALALRSHINLVSKFDRKHYFYADLPAGYQITQQRQPLAMGGEVPYILYNPAVGLHKPVIKTARLIQIQLEQDSGKSLHDPEDAVSLIDLNRAGVGLMEIVTEPDFSCGEEAAAFVKELQTILQTIGTCDGKMSEGSMRVDASVSIHHPGEPLGTRAEVKNINSIRNVGKAVDYEIMRQTEILDSGGTISNETRSFDHETGTTVTMRDKEKLHDYRFMPEPNLPPLRLHTSNHPPPEGLDYSQVIYVDLLQEELPILPQQRREQLQMLYGIPMEHAYILVKEPGLQNMFESLAGGSRESVKLIINMLVNNVMALLNEDDRTFEECPIPASELTSVFNMLSEDYISQATSKKVLKLLYEDGTLSARQIVSDNNWMQISDPQQLGQLCDEVMRENQDSVAAYRGGKKKVFNFLVGQAQKKTNGCAEPKILIQIFTQKLKES